MIPPLFSVPSFHLKIHFLCFSLTTESETMRTLIPRNSGSFLNWLTSPRPAAQAASTSSRSPRSPIPVEILPGVTLDRLPVRPIRPPSAFNLFLKERMIPGQRAAPQMKELASAWKSVSVQDKARFENKSKPAMVFWTLS